jgi:predicted MFS family arabinose efflux permease
VVGAAAQPHPRAGGSPRSRRPRGLAHPLVGRLLLAEAVTYLFGGFFLALYMVLALETLRLSPAAAGLVISVGGVGAFAGALLAAPLGHALGTGRALAVSLAVGQAANLLVPLAAHAGRWAVPLLATQQLVGDAFLGAYIVHTVSLRQRELPESVLGRANATFHVVTGALLPAGALLAGPLAATLGITATLWVGAVGGLLAPMLLAGGISRRDVIVAIVQNGA